MSTIAPDTPAAQALSTAVHAKLVEEGWTQDDDTSLAEYIVLMLANGKTQDQIASELAGELLQDATGTTEFAQWLFQQVESMQEPSQHEKPAAQAQSGSASVNTENAIPAAYEMDMADAAPENAPRGPKGLHGGRPQTNRGGRNSVSNKGADAALHRTRGNDRINSHANLRGAPKGPRSSQDRGVRPGMHKALHNMGLMGNATGLQNSIMMNNGQQGQSPMQMSPQQQMEFMAMMEQQTRMMAQLTGMMPGGNESFVQNGGQQNGHGRSLFDRVEPSRGRGGARGRGRGGVSQNGHHKSSTKPVDTDSTMEGGEESADATSMEVEQSGGQTKQQDPASTMCRFNLRCANPECPYVHQSPAAPPGTVVDMSDTCSFGVACRNSKCVAKHPSPAQIKAYQAQQVCKFWPNCTKPNCPYKHPDAPLCRFGSNCKTPNCHFTHLETPCHFNPCTNMRCPYKHEPGQQKVTSLADMTWTPDKASQSEQAAGADTKDHVSDRRFVDENAGEEELVKPEAIIGNGEAVIT